MPRFPSRPHSIEWSPHISLLLLKYSLLSKVCFSFYEPVITSHYTCIHATLVPHEPPHSDILFLVVRGCAEGEPLPPACVDVLPPSVSVVSVRTSSTGSAKGSSSERWGGHCYNQLD